MSARAQILTRVRTALGRQSPPPPWQRAYHTRGPLDPGDPQLLHLLTDRLRDYAATVRHCTPADLATVLAEVSAGWRIVVPPGFPLPPAGAIADDPPLDHRVLDSVDAVLTGCAAACADTGTIALDAGPDQGRRALTLIPDRHICVVHAQQVVHTVPELVRRLDPLRPLTFISGPSATSDIELNRVEGVHGPRTLVVVLVEDE